MMEHSEEPKLCEGYTRGFRPCRMKAVQYCRFHDPNRPRCSAQTIHGFQCAISTKENHKFCWRHRN